MAPLITLAVVFIAVYLINRFLLADKLSMSMIGRIAIAAMLLVTGFAHFTSADAMIQMMPESIPAKRELVYFTGVCEMLAVPGLLWNRTARMTGILLIVFFVVILPANIAGSLRSVPFGGMENGPWYLAFRLPLQVFFIVWTWVFAVASVERTNN